uniref:Transposase n=1 Tax=Parastrongyloides trichosuri TaxID=131310 RepID=A0A0N5A0W5_PARTI
MNLGRQKADPDGRKTRTARDDGGHRVGLCQQQHRIGRHCADPDRANPRRPVGRFGSAGRARARASGTGGPGSQVDHA